MVFESCKKYPVILLPQVAGFGQFFDGLCRTACPPGRRTIRQSIGHRLLRGFVRYAVRMGGREAAQGSEGCDLVFTDDRFFDWTELEHRPYGAAGNIEPLIILPNDMVNKFKSMGHARNAVLGLCYPPRATAGGIGYFNYCIHGGKQTGVPAHTTGRIFTRMVYQYHYAVDSCGQCLGVGDDPAHVGRSVFICARRGLVERVDKNNGTTAESLNDFGGE